MVLLQQRTAARLAAAAHEGELLARRTTVGHPASSHAARGVVSAQQQHSSIRFHHPKTLASWFFGKVFFVKGTHSPGGRTRTHTLPDMLLCHQYWRLGCAGPLDRAARRWVLRTRLARRVDHLGVPVECARKRVSEGGGWGWFEVPTHCASSRPTILGGVGDLVRVLLVA